eukprot:1147887-Pelagomonas_calceolata.AAC.3
MYFTYHAVTAQGKKSYFCAVMNLKVITKNKEQTFFCKGPPDFLRPMPRRINKGPQAQTAPHLQHN